MFQSKSTPRTPAAYSVPCQQFGPQFKVAHQRVSIDVDFSKHCIVGTTELIIIPMTAKLEYLVLDCKEMRIKDIILENRRLDNFVHDDPYRRLSENFLNGSQEDILYRDNSVEQSHLFRKKFAEFNHNPEGSSKSQLLVRIPPSVKIVPHDSSSLSNYIGTGASASNITPSLKNTPSTFPGEAVYTPLTLKVDFEVNHPNSGIIFDTVSTEHYLWNAYTSNSELNSSVSHWLPCVDSLDEKCTWEIEISVPKRVKDIGTTKVVGTRTLRRKRTRDRRGMVIDDYDDDDEEEEEEEEDNEEDSELNENANREIVVICSEIATKKETAHPMDMAKKTVSFQIFTPVAPHHIGWAVGAFNSVELPSILQADEEEEIDDSKLRQKEHLISDEVKDEIPIVVFTLPTQDLDENMVLNSTIVCQEIIDFYSKEFGSYPFTSYALVFLPTLPSKSLDFTSATFFNSRLLYPPELIDPLFSATNELAWGLANQWAGVNVTPLELNDTWCVVGMAGYMVLQLIKRLMGLNEFKYRIKMAAEAIVEQDWEKQPIGSLFDSVSLPVSTVSNDIDFIKLKAPMVLFILDRRMTKTERSFGMSRVLPKIYLQAMSGELNNNSLSSSHFQKVCERVNKNRLENFFKQWVYGSGAPIFRITQRFNKKRMVIEMGIRQVQLQELGQGKVIGEHDFHSSATEYLQEPEKNMTQVFTGSMTIRIHEADGTPYEHIVEIKDVFTKLDIQYNTKYKRLKRRRKVYRASHEANEILLGGNVDDDNANEDVVLINCLGDVLTSKDECSTWNLTDPMITSEEDDFQQQNEAFEWIRIDSDFEWICKIHINQPDYMFTSQLQQDRDVEAQLESIWFFEDVIANSSTNSLVYSSILTRTAMDTRYFHGVRTAACKALSKFVIKTDNSREFLGGAHHLVQIFKHFFCYKNSNIPKNNDFSDFQRYVLQKSIPDYLSSVRNDVNISPKFVRQFLLDILRYNDNSENVYNDTIYVSNLLNCLVSCTLTDKDDKNFIQEVLNELQRFHNLDEWTPSYQFTITNTILLSKVKLSAKGLYDFQDLNKILEYTLMRINANEYPTVCHAREGLQDISLTAFQILLLNGGIKNREALKYFFENMCFNPDPFIRIKLVDTLVATLNGISAKVNLSDLEDDFEYLLKEICPDDPSLNDLMMIEEDFSKEMINRREMQLRSSISGMITLIRQKFKKYKPLKDLIWDILHSPIISVYQRRTLFDVANVIYQLSDVYQVSLPLPRDKKLICRHLGNNLLVIKREGLLKVHLAPLKVSSDSKVSSGTLKINLAKKNQKSVSNPPIVKKKKKPSIVKSSTTKVGSLPLRFVKICTKKCSVDVSSVAFNKNVVILKSNRRTLSIKISIPDQEKRIQ